MLNSKFSTEMTEDEYEYMREDYIGLCTACGAERDCCEPDAADYSCEECDSPAVYGIETLLVMGLVEISD